MLGHAVQGDFEVVKLVARTVEAFAPQARAKGLVLNSVIEDAVPRTLHGDSELLARVLDAVLAGALESAEAGQVGLRVRMARGEVCFEVADSHFTLPLAATAATLVDAVRIRKLREEFGPIVTQLMRIYADTTPSLMGELRAAIGGGERGPITRAAHQLKGASTMVGAQHIALLAQTIETAPEAGVTLIGEIAAGLDETYAALDAALEH
jgi:HPt (histidine-containing phosphotransfer) domain-containing protein